MPLFHRVPTFVYLDHLADDLFMADVAFVRAFFFDLRRICLGVRTSSRPRKRKNYGDDDDDWEWNDEEEDEEDGEDDEEDEISVRRPTKRKGGSKRATE